MNRDNSDCNNRSNSEARLAALKDSLSRRRNRRYAEWVCSAAEMLEAYEICPRGRWAAFLRDTGESVATSYRMIDVGRALRAGLEASHLRRIGIVRAHGLIRVELALTDNLVALAREYVDGDSRLRPWHLASDEIEAERWERVACMVGALAEHGDNDERGALIAEMLDPAYLVGVKAGQALAFRSAR